MAEPVNASAVSELQALVQEYQLPVAPELFEPLCAYCQLLWKLNEQVNLTRHVDWRTFVTRDLIDCLQLANVVGPAEQVLDVGSGGGVPGIVLAILRPDLQVSLSESVGKKAAALESIVAELGLPVPVYAERAENVLQNRHFQSVTARAVGPLPKMLQAFAGCWGAMERLLLIKGPRWVAERAEARHRGLLRTLELRRLVAYDMPEHDGQSVILSIWPK